MTDVEIVQWFFDLEKISEAFNWPVTVSGFVAAKRTLDRLLDSKAAAADVLEAYKAIAGAIGPTVMNMLVESDDAFAEINHSGKPTPVDGGRKRRRGDRVAAVQNGGAQPRHPQGFRGDRHHQAPPLSIAPRRRFQPPSTPAAVCGT